MADAPTMRGITDRDREFLVQQGEPDVRPFKQKFASAMRVRGNLVMVLSAAVLMLFLIPWTGGFLLPAIMLVTFYGLSRYERAPLKIPIQDKLLDENEPHPVTRAPTLGQGIFFLGSDIYSGKEIWLTNSDCRQHFLILGTTGAGKALPVDTRIHTPSGWRRIGDIVVGDTVTGAHGQPVTVLGAYPQGVLPTATVTLEDGRTLDASHHHLWEVIDESGAKDVVTTLDLEALLSSGSHVRVAHPRGIEFGENTRISADTLRSAAIRIGLYDAPFDRLPGPDACWEEMLPAGILEDSRERRLLFVRHIVWCRGETGADGSWTVTDMTRGPAVGLVELVRSLGGWASLTRVPPLVDEAFLDRRDAALQDGYRVCLFLRELNSVGFEGCALQDPRFDSAAVQSVQLQTSLQDSTCILLDSKDHLFVSEGYVVTHNTEILLTFGANALSWGSGFLFVDGKGDISLYAKVFALCRRWNREDDFLVLNFMTGGKSGHGSSDGILSNTLNPFSAGSADTLVQMIVSLMPGSGGGNGDMWKGRAVAMLTGVLYALVWLRDSGYTDLSVHELRDFMMLNKIMSLVDPQKYPDMPPAIVKAVKAYLSSLAGFKEEAGEKQSSTTLEQHGYLEMQFTQVLGSLGDVYGHIFNERYGEIDMFDVVLNRRILVVMLPSLEKSDSETANLGKIIVANLKGMMGATLGHKLEGDWEDIVENRVTNSPSPFITVLDEVGYYTVTGMAVMAAQARSLGFSMVYASQDINAMRRLDEKEANSIIANTNTKGIMRTEDADTGKLASEAGGKGSKIVNEGYRYNDEAEFGGSWRANDNVRTVNDKDNIDFLDLKNQDSGYLHIIHKGIVVRARSFYVDPPSSLETNRFKLRPNHFIAVPRPNLGDIEQAARTPILMATLTAEDLPNKMKEACEARIDETRLAPDCDIGLAADMFAQCEKFGRTPIVAGCLAIAALVSRNSETSINFSRAVSSNRVPLEVQASSGGNAMPDDIEEFTPDMMMDQSIGAADYEPIMDSDGFGDIPHSIQVDGDDSVDMGDELSLDPATKKAFASLHSDPSNMVDTKQSVSDRLDAAIGTPDSLSFDDASFALAQADEEFSRTEAAFHSGTFGKAPDEVEETAERGGGNGAGAVEDDEDDDQKRLLSEFIEMIKSDENGEEGE